MIIIISRNDGDIEGEGSDKGKWLYLLDDIGNIFFLFGIILN